jgi:hypothetical protein
VVTRTNWRELSESFEGVDVSQVRPVASIQRFRIAARIFSGREPERLGAWHIAPGHFSTEDELMKTRSVLALASAVVMLPAVAFAQQDPVSRNANEGARTGGAVGGPVGAIVGGTVGVATGLAEGITTGVVDAVRGAPVPNVVVRERVAVGEPLPGSVRLYTVPRYERYRYAVVNDQRVIVDPQTRVVIRVID